MKKRKGEQVNEGRRGMDNNSAWKRDKKKEEGKGYMRKSI